MAEQRKQELLTKLRPIIQKMVDAAALLSSCVASSRDEGAFNIPAAVQAMTAVVGVQKDLGTVVQGYAADAGSGGAALAGFTQFQFRTTVTLLVEALKKAMDNGNIEELDRQTEQFKQHPRTLVELVKNMSFATSDELDDQTDNVILPNEMSLPRFVLIITDYNNDFALEKMREGRRVFQELKLQYKELELGKLGCYRVRRKDRAPIDAPYPDVKNILAHINIESLRGYPVFAMIYKGKYYWYRNIQFRTDHLSNWIDDLLSGAAYLTGEIDYSKIPKIVQYFWKIKSDDTEFLTRAKLKDGHPTRQNLIDMGAAPETWHGMWFVTVEQDGSTFFLESIFEFQKKFQRMLHPVNPTKEWAYRYIVPCLEWPGWGKYPELATKGAKDIKISTNLQYLKPFMVVNDDMFDLLDFRRFFEGETEDMVPVEPKVEHDIDEFGDIGQLSWDGPEFDAADVNLDGMSKAAVRLAKAEEALAKAHHKEVEKVATHKMSALNLNPENLGEVPYRARKGGDPLADAPDKVVLKPKAAPGTQGVQDTMFDYLGEMLEKNVLGFETDEFGDVEDVDI